MAYPHLRLVVVSTIAGPPGFDSLDRALEIVNCTEVGLASYV